MLGTAKQASLLTHNTDSQQSSTGARRNDSLTARQHFSLVRSCVQEAHPRRLGKVYSHLQTPKLGGGGAHRSVVLLQFQSTMTGSRVRRSWTVSASSRAHSTGKRRWGIAVGSKHYTDTPLSRPGWDTPPALERSFSEELLPLRGRRTTGQQRSLLPRTCHLKAPDAVEPQAIFWANLVLQKRLRLPQTERTQPEPEAPLSGRKTGPKEGASEGAASDTSRPGLVPRVRRAARHVPRAPPAGRPADPGRHSQEARPRSGHGGRHSHEPRATRHQQPLLEDRQLGGSRRPRHRPRFTAAGPTPSPRAPHAASRRHRHAAPARQGRRSFPGVSRTGSQRLQNPAWQNAFRAVPRVPNNGARRSRSEEPGHVAPSAATATFATLDLTLRPKPATDT